MKKRNRTKFINELVPVVIFSTLILGAIVFLIVTNVKINKRRSKMISEINILEEKVKILEEKNKELKEVEVETKSDDYLEKVAREQLDLKKPGEEVVVIQKELTFTEGFGEAGEEKETWWDKIKSIWTRD